MEGDVIVVTTPSIPGYRVVRVIGLVHGSTVRARGLGGQIVAGIETIVGGEVTAYVRTCEEAKQEATDRAIENAKRTGANAIIGADFETSDILNGVATLFSLYGTAVVVEKG